MVTRQYQEGDDEEIVELLKSSFPDWLRTQDALMSWKWKYLNSPLKTCIAVTLVGNKIVGVGHTCRMNVKFGDSVKIGYLDDDYATHPEYRKMGIYNATQIFLDNYRSENSADFCYWLTMNPIVLNKSNLHEQVDFTTPISDLLRIRDYEHFIGKIPNDSEFSHLRSRYKSMSIPQITIKDDLSYDFEILEIEYFDERFEAFWSEVANDYDYITIRDCDSMNWRFSKNPLNKYLIKAILFEGKVLGYVVLGVDNSEDYTLGLIWDLLHLKNLNDVAFLLLKEAVNYFDSLNVDCIEMITMQEHIDYKIANSLGFIDARAWNLRFWGYNEYFYKTIKSLKPDKVLFNYLDA